MGPEALFCKSLSSLAEETPLKILRLLSGTEELGVRQVIDVLSVTPGSPGEKLLKLPEEMVAPQPEAQALRGHLARCLEAKRHSRCARGRSAGRKGSRWRLPETQKILAYNT